MKILVLAPQPFLQMRGTPLAVRRLIQVLGDAGHDIHLLTLHEGEDVTLRNCVIERIVAPPGVKHVPPGFSIRKVICDLFLLAAAIRRLRAEEFDVVHAVEESVFIAMLLKFWFGVPYVYDIDSSIPEQMRHRFPWLTPVVFLMRWAERKAIRQSLGAVVVCRELETIVRSVSPRTSLVRVEDVSPHHDLSRHLSNHEVVSPWKDLPGLVILYIGNLQPYQGIPLLLRSIRALMVQARTPDDLQLLIVGGSQRNIRKHARLARRLGIAKNVSFLGEQPLELIPCFLEIADLTVSPRTQGSNTPMKLYTYLESGVPLVATRISSHTQVVSDQECWLAELSPESMASSIANALEQPDVSLAKAVAAQRLIATQYDVHLQAERLRDFYENIEIRFHRPDKCVATSRQQFLTTQEQVEL